MSAKGRKKRAARGAEGREEIRPGASDGMPKGGGLAREWLPPAALLLAFALLSIHGMLRWSATYDEHVYATAGFEQAEAGRFRFKRDAPPLVPQLAWISARAGATLLGRGVEKSALGAASDGVDEYIASRGFFLSQPGGGVALLRAARLPSLAFGVALGVYLFLFALAMFGRAAALLSLAVFAFDPNMLAHSRILSADIPLASLFLAAHFHCWRALASGSRAQIAATAIAASMAMLAKFTGLLVLPSLLALTMLAWARTPESRRRTVASAAWGATAIAASFIVLATLLFRGADGVFRYFEGARSIYSNIRPSYSNYFMGEFSERPFAGYCVAAMILKTPVAALGLALLALPAAFARRESKEGWIRLAAALLPFALIHAVAAFDRVNLGVRRVLFAYPFLFLWIGSLAAGADLPSLARRRYLRAIAWALAALAAVESLARHPNQLSFFNLACGGPKNGWRYLDDSNIDWGQDLPALRDALRARGVDRVVLDYFGVDNPSSYGIEGREMAESEYANPRPEVYAVSVHYLIHRRAAAGGPASADWLASRRPDAMAGYSIYIYDLRAPASQ